MSAVDDLARPIAGHTWVAVQCGLQSPSSVEKSPMTATMYYTGVYKSEKGYGTFQRRVPRYPTRRLAMAIASTFMLGTVWLLLTSALSAQRTVEDRSAFELQKSWAQYSPYFAAAPYVAPPKYCKIVQANTIQRHGARYPTAGAGKKIVEALAKLQSVSETITDTELSFLKTYTYDLGADDLVASGATESQESGHLHFSRYGHLVSREKLPFVRASGSERVELSATNWTQGFSAASHRRYNPPLSVILSEELNDTLDDAMCPNAGSSDAQTDQWLLQYGTPLAEDLNSKAPGANLTASDVYSLISLCPFETVAKGSSPWCSLFSQADFESFEYSGDLDKYYNTGYGQPLGPVQGVGYINELLARLTGKPVVDHTQTNRTLDSSPDTFPLDRALYIDFSHDNQMIAIYSALGLFHQRTPLDPTQPEPRRTWLASHLVPFGARMITEKLVCGSGRGGKEYVRILVNDAVQPLEFCGIGNGICELGEFVRSQRYARNDGEGDFEKCFS